MKSVHVNWFLLSIICLPRLPGWAAVAGVARPAPVHHHGHPDCDGEGHHAEEEHVVHGGGEVADQGVGRLGPRYLGAHILKHCHIN